MFPEQERRERPVGTVRFVRGGRLAPKVVEECRGEVHFFRVDDLVLDEGGDVIEHEGAAEAGGECGGGHDGYDRGAEQGVHPLG